MGPITSRGFRGRRGDAPSDRVPPGQYVTGDFPVLSAGPTPHTPLEQWDFSIVGELDEPRRWTWEEFRALPSEEVTRRHPLRDEVVEAETPCQTVSSRSSRASRAPAAASAAW